MGNPPLAPETANLPAWRRAEIPAANGHGNARSVARVMAALACGGSLGGVRLLSEAALARATRGAVLRRPTSCSACRCAGGSASCSRATRCRSSPTRRAFGHGGWGGSLGIADPDARVSWAYVMNKMSAGTLGDTRAFHLAQALYASPS